MAGNFTSHLQHLVWSTQSRQPLIAPVWENELYRYLNGIARSKNAFMIVAGGMSDHVHILISIPPTVAISELVNTLKSNSSKWIKENKRTDFAWQSGYGAFSVSKSNQASVIQYICNQKSHHAQLDFKAEFLELLIRHEIDYDPKYIWG